ncbi:Uncharacterised protein [Legionella pneumophila]|nr:Uncharacterised protein [Legionella pneumophila]CZJ26976.1 Uncharacterised protein [Legionella pneumophila]CZJ29283.1 Uncharacterised protein [Legionella pneumophila]CZJ31499.1 Uncharacterised protein [Legionella pneumophila]CZJ35466.1 Uncharacterised protein [Legionella pneumophila]
MVLIIGGGGGNRTRYHVFLDFYEILSKTMRNHANSELSPFLQNAPSCLSSSEIVCGWCRFGAARLTSNNLKQNMLPPKYSAIILPIYKLIVRILCQR